MTLQEIEAEIVRMRDGHRPEPWPPEYQDVIIAIHQLKRALKARAKSDAAELEERDNERRYIKK